MMLEDRETGNRGEEEVDTTTCIFNRKNNYSKRGEEKVCVRQRGTMLYRRREKKEENISLRRI